MVYARVFESYDFDLCIGDETYDLLVAMVNNPSVKKCPFVVIYDILGLDASTWNPAKFELDSVNEIANSPDFVRLLNETRRQNECGVSVPQKSMKSDRDGS